MNIKKIVYMIFTISILILAGCTQQGAVISRTTPFVGGTNALDFNFIAGEPPEEALDQNQLPFVVTVSIENKGEWDVAKENVKISLRGFRAADFSNPATVTNPIENLDKTYIDTDGNIIPGTFTHVTFDNFSYTGILQANNLFPILVDLCYRYGTKAQIDLCYLKDLTQANKDVVKVCEVRGPKTVFSSSAPVSVENVKEDLGGTNKIAFTFDVVQRGPGLVSQVDKDCNALDSFSLKNKVWVEVNSDLAGLSCSGLAEGTATTGYVTLNNGKRNIRCTQDVPGDGDYVKKAQITVKYDYKETKKTEILIRHVTP